MNRIFTEQLTAALTSRLAAVYYLAGSDPLLVNESRDLIVQTAAAQGFDDRMDIQIDSGTDWDALFEQTQSIGLFSARQLIVLHLPDTLNAATQKALQQFVGMLHADMLPVFLLPKLTKAAEKQAWFIQANQYEPQAVLVNCQTPTAEQLPRWVSNRAKSMGLTPDPDAVRLLCYSYENNLLALKQSLQLAALLYPDGKLNAARMQGIVEQASVFTPFQWIDALLAGKGHRATRILHGLRAEDVQPVILLRTLQRELMTILQLTQPQKPYRLDERLSTAALRERFDALKVWQNRRDLFAQTVQRLTYRQLYMIFQQLSELERTIKQEFDADVWEALADIGRRLAHGT